MTKRLCLCGVLLLVCLALSEYFWYTRPLTFEQMLGGRAVVSASMRSTQYDAALVETSEIVFVEREEELQLLREVLRVQSYNRKIPWGSEVAPNLVGVDGMQFLSIDLSVQSKQGALESTSLELSSRGTMQLDGRSIGIGRVGTAQNKRLFEEVIKAKEGCTWSFASL